MDAIGYEVLRNGQGYSTRNPIPGDIPLKVIKGYQGSSSRKQSVISLSEQSRIREKEALKKAAQQKAVADANKEAARIQKLRNSLIASGAKKSVITRRNAAGKEISKIITYQNNVNKVVTSQNLLDGSSSSKTYRYNRLSGGIGYGSAVDSQESIDYKKFQNALYNLKLPIGVTYIKATDGSITGLKKKGTRYSLTNLPQLVPGYFINPTLRTAYKGTSTLNMRKVLSENEPQKKQFTVSTTPVIVPGGIIDKFFKQSQAYYSIRKQRLVLQNKINDGKKLTRPETALYSQLIVEEFAAKIGKDLVQLPKQLVLLLYNLATKPLGTVQSIYSTASQSVGKIGSSINRDPTGILINTAAFIVEYKIISGTRKELTAAIKKNLYKINPKFKGDLVKGTNINIKTKTGNVELQVVNKIPKKSIKAQVGLSGKTVTATSSQSNRLLSILKRSKTLRKPISGEVDFSKATKVLLKKFDAGKITPRELVKLDKLIQQQGAKGILERSFFADPSGKIRPSRLGISTKTATFKDYASGDISFKAPRPQILVFKNIRVPSVPKNLQSIFKKIKVGKTLTKLESAKYLKYHMRVTGTFKSVGFLTRESEILLAPGEILKKGKTLGFGSYKGIKVPLIETSVYKPTGDLLKLIKKYSKQTITVAETTKLDKLIKTKTGFNYGLSKYSTASSAVYINPRSFGLNILLSFNYKKIIPSRKSKIPSSRTSVSKVSRTSGSKVSRTSGSKVSRTSGSKASRTSGSKASRTSGSKTSSSPAKRKRKKRKPLIFPISVSNEFTPKKLSKSINTYYVVEKRRGKYVKLYPKPLKINDAKDYAAYQIDRNLSKTALFIPLSKQKSVVQPPKNIKGYYSKVSKKLRPYRIRYGQKQLIVNGFIEKRKYFQDTKTERVQAVRARAKARKKRKV